MSNVKVFVLMAGLTALFVAIGGALGGQAGMIFALILAGVMNFAAYYGSAGMVLRMYGARVPSAASPTLGSSSDRCTMKRGRARSLAC